MVNLGAVGPIHMKYHAIGVARERRTKIKMNVAVGIKGKADAARRLHPFAGGHRAQDLVHPVGVDVLRRFAGKSENNCPVGAMAPSREGKRAMQADAQPHEALKLLAVEPVEVAPCCHHGPHRVRRRRANADFEQFKD